jgi:hypothetical protein
MMILKSDEGWLKLETKWPSDEPSEIVNIRRMQLKVEYEFHPLHPPSETEKPL